MRKVWLDSYPPSVQAEIDLTEYSSVPDVLAQAFRKYPHHPAFRNLGTTLSYAQLEQKVRDFAAWLQHQPGLHSGSRVALMMPNLLQYPVAFFGVLRAGMIVVNVNPLYTARELEHQLRDSGAEAIVILENFAHVLQQVAGRLSLKYLVVTQIGDLLAFPRSLLVNFAVKRVKKLVPPWHLPAAVDFRAALEAGSLHDLRDVALRPDDIALLQYTGGTTGTSKGAILTHGNLVANLLQAGAWARTTLRDGEEIVVSALPLYHIFSLTVNCLLFTSLGALNLLITNPRDMPAFVKELKKTRFTAITGVNTLYNGLLNTPGFADVDFRALKVAIGGGAAIHHAVAERWKAVTGCPLTEGYGLTEASPLVACNPLGGEFSGSIGLPVPSTDISVRSDDDTELPPGLEGEICVRGPQVMQGYWNRPEETRRILSPGGWLRTGDIGVIDCQGFLRVTDRKKDIIIVSGFNVYPTEVEDVLAEMPGVVESAVVGIPDSITGEMVKAFVVTNGPSIAPEEIIAHCRRHLTSYKVPKLIEFRTELPKNPIGKVLRRELRPAVAQKKVAAAG
ncbi:MAG TPA: AMP-binding protein [Bryobacteraceae bacterium]|nr:AMP-binding protein [Bryobacteraceae bacterium]